MPEVSLLAMSRSVLHLKQTKQKSDFWEAREGRS